MALGSGLAVGGLCGPGMGQFGWAGIGDGTGEDTFGLGAAGAESLKEEGLGLHALSPVNGLHVGHRHYLNSEPIGDAFDFAVRLCRMAWNCIECGLSGYHTHPSLI